MMPQLQILMLTMYEERDLIFNSLRAGAKGCLLKKTPAAELIQAVEQVHAGGSPMSMQIARKVVDHFARVSGSSSNLQNLTPREQRILELLARGSLYKEIAGQLGISISTVKGHVQHIYNKLHVQSRAEARLRFLKGE
jgi:DNA-binding NarL/FixJ family response regulator